ncbi:hypothetical protein I4U23_011930 [Adineta vaga]|nr:hypothetical protein I4U23_011930 [Adineta vaga]
MQFPHPDARILPANISCQSTAQQTSPREEAKVVGSLVGLAIGDALGASVEFRPRQYLVDHPVRDMQGGGTWGLQAGQWTDDTSMALCLASSLLTQRGFNTYDQMVRYKWWYKKGYLSSTGQCFDIGNSTRAALEEFCRRQNVLKQHFRNASDEQIDNLPLEEVRNVKGFSEFCGGAEQAGNGALMRLAPVPLFFYRQPERAVHLAGESALLTHGDPKAADACRYFAALLVAAIKGTSKKELLDEKFVENHTTWFGSRQLHPDVISVAKGSFKKQRGYEDGIRGKNYIINTLEAALWAFWSDGDNFENGVLNAVNLGDDTDTTAAVYGQLAGAYYGASVVLRRWGGQLYARNLLVCIGQWLCFEGSRSQGGSSSTQQQQQQQMPSYQSHQHSIPVSQHAQQITKKLPEDIMGYGNLSQPKSTSHGRVQASSQSHHSDNRSDYYSNNPKQKQKQDPSKMPTAGLPSGHHRK